VSDEGFREIQLNGKQLVFLFMAASVVSVVIFLCGVMVGRGVRAERGELADASAEAVIDPTADTSPLPASTGTSESASPSSQENLSYPERLGAQSTPPETLKEPAPVEPAPTSAPPRADEVRTSTEPARNGFAVQVAASRERTEAETIASRLVAKGYPAYVMAPAPGAARFYRVRVGTFTDRREAESVANRLEQQEQFKPWITR
jgi:cell division septation protein DedD